MSVSLTAGAYESFHELYSQASASTTKYAPFPRLSEHFKSCQRWKEELLESKCIQEVVVGKERFYRPIIAPSQTKAQNRPRGKNADPVSEPVKKQKIPLTPGASASLARIIQNVEKSSTGHVAFPDISNNKENKLRWSMQLVDKKCIKEIVIGKKYFYAPLVTMKDIANPKGVGRPLSLQPEVSVEHVQTSLIPEASPPALPPPSAVVVTAPEEQMALVTRVEIGHPHPVSRGRHLPNGHLLIEFVNAVQRELHVLKADRMVQIADEITKAKTEFLNTSDTDYEKLYIREIAKLVDERAKLNDQALIDAIKYVEAKKEFAGYAWSNEIVSIRPEDYVIIAPANGA